MRQRAALRHSRIGRMCSKMGSTKAAAASATNTDDGLTTTTVWSHDG